jgi:hypothetical protein
MEKIADSTENYVAWRVKGKGKQRFVVRYTYRRIGEDNGMDTLVHLDNNLRRALDRIEEIIYRPPPDAEPNEITKSIFLTGY